MASSPVGARADFSGRSAGCRSGTAGRRPAAAAATTSSSRTDPPGWTTARTPASSSTCSPSANGKNASDAATEPAARSPARATASRAESTRLTCPMPTPTVARSWASRIALLFTARTARQAKTRSSRPAASSGSPVASVQVVGSSPGASSRSLTCSSRPPLIGRISAPGAGQVRQRAAAGCSSSPVSTSHRVVGERRRDDHLGEDLGDLLGHRQVDLAVGGDHPAERRDRVAGVRLAVRRGDVGADGDPARVGVLDDRHARVGVVVRGPPGGVGVDVVVVGHLLAVQLLGVREARLPARGTARRPGAGSRRSAGRRRAPSSRRPRPGSRSRRPAPRRCPSTRRRRCRRSAVCAERLGGQPLPLRRG